MTFAIVAGLKNVLGDDVTGAGLPDTSIRFTLDIGEGTIVCSPDEIAFTNSPPLTVTLTMNADLTSSVNLWPFQGNVYDPGLTQTVNNPICTVSCSVQFMFGPDPRITTSITNDGVLTVSATDSTLHDHVQ
jgi:hypothetical protein